MVKVETSSYNYLQHTNNIQQLSKVIKIKKIQSTINKLLIFLSKTLFLCTVVYCVFF